MLKTTGQFHFYQYLERYFRKLFITVCLNIFWKIIFCLISSLGSVQEIHALRNYLPSLMRYINHHLETRGVFLDISKAFDKVWHEGLLFKLKCYGVESSFYNILENYLHDRKQRVVLSGQSSSWLKDTVTLEFTFFLKNIFFINI